MLLCTAVSSTSWMSKFGPLRSKHTFLHCMCNQFPLPSSGSQVKHPVSFLRTLPSTQCLTTLESLFPIPSTPPPLHCPTPPSCPASRSLCASEDVRGVDLAVVTCARESAVKVPVHLAPRYGKMRQDVHSSMCSRSLMCTLLKARRIYFSIP